MKKVEAILFYILSVIFLTGAAIYNGYPIVYSDTSTYLVSGFELIPPFDRSISYGAKIIWFIPLAAMILLSQIIYKFIDTNKPSLQNE